MAITDDSLQYLENFEVYKNKVLLSGIVESLEITYVGEKRYRIDTFVQAFEYFVLSQSTYNHLRQNFQLPSISTITKRTSKQKQLCYLFSFSTLAMVISNVYNFGVGRYHVFSMFLCCSRCASEKCVYSNLTWNDCQRILQM